MSREAVSFSKISEYNALLVIIITVLHPSTYLSSNSRCLLLCILDISSFLFLLSTLGVTIILYLYVFGILF